MQTDKFVIFRRDMLTGEPRWFLAKDNKGNNFPGFVRFVEDALRMDEKTGSDVMARFSESFDLIIDLAPECRYAD